MPTKYSGRITLIVLVALAALWAIFPSPAKLFDGDVPFGQKINLKPGIDMVGGTSLLYEIQPPEGSSYSSGLAEQVMASLKKRVDPEGVRNLIWRPQGANRLEIQMPLTAGAQSAQEKREALSKAEVALEETNVSPAEVLATVERAYNEKDPQDDARQRAAALAKLEKGSPARRALFPKLAETWRKLLDARRAEDAEAAAELEVEYERLQGEIERTNLRFADLSADLAAPDARAKKDDADKQAAAREQRYAEHLKNAEGFPARRAAIEQYRKAFDEFDKVRNLIDDVSDLKRKLQGAGILEFRILARDASPAERERMTKRLLERGPRTEAGDTLKWFEADRPEEHVGETVEYNGKHYLLAWNEPAVGNARGLPPRVLDHREGTRKWNLQEARRTRESDLSAQQVVGFTFDVQGGAYFSELTGANINQPLATVLDGRVISVANINSRIGSSGIIQGDFDSKELDYLVSTFNAGSLPAQLNEEPISERTVGPQIGEDNLRRGLAACLFGLVVVAFFLIGYYYLAGVVATFAVLLNMVIILGVMAMFDATFTLPAIAGIVLTIGMAVDANVLIFERLREEQVRGLSLRMALRNAYDRAWSAILDGNVTTGITAAALYAFGSEEVKGFGLTLMIGIFASLFTALFVTKTIFGLLIDKLRVQDLSSLPRTFPKWDRMLRPNIDWMGKAWAFYAFSAVFIVTGLTLFGVRWAQGKILDVEFTKGTSIQFDLKQPMRIDQVRGLINAESEANPTALPSPSVVSVGQNDLTYEVVTPNENSVAVRQAVVAALDENLKVDIPSKYAGSGITSLEDAIAQGLVVPIKSATQRVGGFLPDRLPAHVGGVAVVLRDLDPRVSAQEAQRRVDEQRLRAEGMRHRFEVAADPAGGGTIVVLASDPSFPYVERDSLKQQQWKDELAAPVWRVVRDAITSPAELQKVSNFDAQVAGETQRQALIALVVSVGLIMAYIWARFGNLKYGSATVIALLHDTLFCLAAVGFAHYLAEVGALREGLLLEPFRVNLTLVAAVLTVMGYSMNDTVVIFDRIRENRGKYGVVSRQVINDSINQTLSRTLLTGGTTILTIFVMYVFGGPGIHGFTFVLLIGILVGTYSSIAIASPILLLGSGRRLESPATPASARPVAQLQRAGT